MTQAVTVPNDARARVADAAAGILRTPYADLSGRFGAPQTDLPALAAAAVAVPVAVGAIARGFLALVGTGAWFAIGVAAISAAASAAMACACVALMWAAELATGHLRLPPESWGRAYAYAALQLCAIALGGTALALPLSYLAMAAMTVGCIRRAQPYTVAALAPTVLAPFLGLTAAYLGSAMYFASGVPGLLLAFLRVFLDAPG